MVEPFQRYQIGFRPIEQADIELLRQWRNRDDIRLMMVDQQEVSQQQQQQWFTRLDDNPDKQHFALVFRDQLIGYANVHFDHDSAATGLYIGQEKYRGSLLAFCVGVGLSEWCFEQPQVQRIQAQVAPHNQAALRFNDALGYQRVRQDADWVYLNKDEAQFRAARDKLMPILARFN